MKVDLQKLTEAKEVLMNMANGINPLNGKMIEDSSFLNDPKIIRSLYYLITCLEANVFQGVQQEKVKQTKNYEITQELLNKIEFPPGYMGINEFCRIVNEHINSPTSKKLTHTPIYKKLKSLGILTEEVNEEGRTRSRVTDKANNYGILEIDREYNGQPYKQIVFDNDGKEFLRRNLLKLLDIEGELKS